MSINASWLRMFLEMRRRHDFTRGAVACLGVQDAMFTHAVAAELIAERGVEPVTIPTNERRFHYSRNQRQFSPDPRHYMSIHDLFRMLGYDKIDALDAFPNDGPDLLWDLNNPVPAEWHGQYDLLFDIGVLEHVADIFQAIENVGALVRVGGWLCLNVPLLSPINTCFFHPNPPFYFDVLSANGFDSFDCWINWMPDWDQRHDIRTMWLNYQYNDDVEIARPHFFTTLFLMARKREHVENFKPVLQNFYRNWHAGQPLMPSAPEADSAASTAWRFPTAGSALTEEQRRFLAVESHGIAIAPVPIHAPITARPQPGIAEQMIAGGREQLYL